MNDDKPKASGEPREIRTYREWSAHRYDPGHYLGGNLAPHLDKSRLGPSARRKAGLLLGVMALISIMATVSSWPLSGPFERVAQVALTALVTAAAFRMYRS